LIAPAAVKLVAFDVDGTLVGRDLVVRPRVRAAIEAMRARGIDGCLVTGRMYRAAVGYAHDLHFDAPLVCYQGAGIVDPRNGMWLREVPLQPPAVERVLMLARQFDVHVQLYRNDSYYCEQNNQYSQLYARLSGVEPILVPSLRDAFAGSGATKAVAITDPPRASELVERFTASLGADAYVTRSYPEFIEILSPAVDKGEALRFVAEKLGVAMREVMAIGDSWNDAPLLKSAGLGIAMGSAPPELRAVAAAVVADVAHDGVAEALERYVIA
jgi:Cof subfamily protein (haloacid dehalogenase superfamily)